MNIALFTNNYLPNPFGVSMSIESFRREFEKNGHTVYVFAPGAKSYIDESGNIFRYPAIDLHFKSIHFPLAIPYSHKISRILEGLEIDLIHAQHPNLLGWEAKRWAKKKNIPLIFTWHTLYDQYTHFVPPLIPKKLATWWTIKNAVNYANLSDAVVTPTPKVAEIIRKWGVKNENMAIVPTGIDEDLMDNPDRGGLRNKIGIKDDECLLVTVSRVTAEKNLEFLLEAVLEVLQKNKRTKYLLCGDGDLLATLEARAGSSGFKERVLFAGIVPSSEKKNYFAAGDVFVHASKSETQGMILTEAMYAGLPIVAVDATGACDLVEDGQTGYLVAENRQEFADKVLQLVENTQQRREMGERAAKIAREKYTAAVCAGRMLATYEGAIRRKRKQSV